MIDAPMTDLATLSAPQLLEHVGRVLYGGDWQSPLARSLALNPRTMQRISAATRDGKPYPIAPGVLDDLLQLVDERAREIDMLFESLTRVVARAPLEES